MTYLVRTEQSKKNSNWAKKNFHGKKSESFRLGACHTTVDLLRCWDKDTDMRYVEGTYNKNNPIIMPAIFIF